LRFEVGVYGGKVKPKRRCCPAELFRAGAAPRHQRSAVHEDRELLGGAEQLERHEHEPDRRLPQGVEQKNGRTEDQKLRDFVLLIFWSFVFLFFRSSVQDRL
jgi:hypothetical protein